MKINNSEALCNMEMSDLCKEQNNLNAIIGYCLIFMKSH